MKTDKNLSASDKVKELTAKNIDIDTALDIVEDELGKYLDYLMLNKYENEN